LWQQETGAELWITDGTADGTRLIADICPGSCSSAPELMQLVGSKVLFVASDLDHGQELWATDGSEEGTELVFDHWSGPTSGFLGQGAVLQGVLYYSARDEGHGLELWRSDGTPDGTFLLKDLCPGECDSDPYPTTVGDLVFFRSRIGNQETTIWRTDGTVDGTQLLLSLDQGQFFSFQDPQESFAATDGGAVFVVREGESYSLWRSTGTPQGTEAFSSGHNRISGLTSADHWALMLIDTPEHGGEPWATDGTASGTMLLADIEPGPEPSSPDSFLVHDGQALFAATSWEHGRELWRTDGTTAGTMLVKDIAPPAASSWPTLMGVAGSNLVLATLSGRHTIRSLDTVTGSQHQLVADVYLMEATTFAGETVFATLDTLWISDGTSAGTEVLVTGDLSAQPSQLRRAGDRLFFAAALPSGDGRCLWLSDGTPAGTQPVVDTDLGYIVPVPWQLDQLPHPRMLTLLGNDVVFTAVTSDDGLGLWRSDGSAEGTELLLPLESAWPIPRWPQPEESSLANGTAALSNNSSALLVTDGTADGSFFIELGEGVRSSHLHTLNDAVYLVLEHPDRHELWRLDGSQLRLIHDLRLDDEPGFVTESIAINDHLFLGVFHASTGAELWISNGSSAETRLLRDIRPGVRGSGLSSFAAIDGILVFAADDGRHGLELWRSSGTRSGTRLVADVAPGRPPSNPAGFTQVGATVFFSADDGVTGRELWGVPRSALGPCRVGDPLCFEMPPAGSSGQDG
jgi:ELWxxDGT repeat protein